MDCTGHHKIQNFAPPKGQVACSNPARDANTCTGFLIRLHSSFNRCDGKCFKICELG